MPCNSEYLEPSYDEVESQNVCINICYLFPKVGRTVPKWVKRAAEDCYGNPAKLSEAETMLYECIKGLNDKEIESYVYDARSKKARNLANWYEDFHAVYKREKMKRKREKELKEKAESVLSKLRRDEVKIIKKYFKTRSG